MSIKLTRDEIKALIKSGAIWLGVMIGWRILTMILWSMFFGSTIDDELNYDVGTSESRFVTVLSSFVSMILLAVVTNVIFARNNGDARRCLVEASREQGFTLIGHFKKYIPQHILYLTIYLATQLIFCGFFAAFGFRYNAATGGTVIEHFHVADSGFYLLTNNAILGLLLNTIVMTALLCGGRLLVLWRWKNEKIDR